jgi:hypothetical protein
VIAMQHVQSNTAALLNATPALWIAWLGTFGRRPAPLTGAQQAGLFVGLAACLLILAPRGGFHAAGLGWQLLILLGCLSWSLGTHYHRNAEAANPPLMFVALQMLAGGLGLLVIAPLSGEPLSFALDPARRRGFPVPRAREFLPRLLGVCLAHRPRASGPRRLLRLRLPGGRRGARLAGARRALSWIQLAGMGVILAGIALVTGYWRPLPPSRPPDPERIDEKAAAAARDRRGRLPLSKWEASPHRTGGEESGAVVSAADDGRHRDAFESQQSGVEVSGAGTVSRILDDDREGEPAPADSSSRSARAGPS